MTDFESTPAEFKPDDSPTPIVANKPVHRRNLDLFARQLAAEFLPELDEEKLEIIANFDRYSGGEVLVHLAGAIERMGIKSLKDATSSGGRIGEMANLVAPLEPEDPAPIVESLKAFKPATLKLLLPYSGAGEPLLVAALDLEDSPEQAFYDHLMGQVKANSPLLEYDWESPFQNNTDPANGVLDPLAIREAAKGLSAKDRKAAIKMLDLPGDRSLSNAKLLFSAVFGDNDKRVRDSLKRNSQPAAKALGLLPLPEKGLEAELDARYVALLEFEKSCQKFGTERRANSAAAVRVGLSNLAANAGFADAERLAWSVETPASRAGQRLGGAPSAGRSRRLRHRPRYYLERQPDPLRRKEGQGLEVDPRHRCERPTITKRCARPPTGSRSNTPASGESSNRCSPRKSPSAEKTSIRCPACRRCAAFCRA